jgi:hypothetical protein
MWLPVAVPVPYGQGGCGGGKEEVMRIKTNSVMAWAFCTVLFVILFGIYWSLCLVRFPFIGVCLGIDWVNVYMWKGYHRACVYFGGGIVEASDDEGKKK